MTAAYIEAAPGGEVVEEEGSKFTVVGLGNPEAERELTRHNVGYLFLDWLAEHLGMLAADSRDQKIGKLTEGWWSSFTGDAAWKNRRFVDGNSELNLFKPASGMNSA